MEQTVRATNGFSYIGGPGLTINNKFIDYCVRKLDLDIDYLNNHHVRDYLNIMYPNIDILISGCSDYHIDEEYDNNVNIKECLTKDVPYSNKISFGKLLTVSNTTTNKTDENILSNYLNNNEFKERIANIYRLFDVNIDDDNYGLYTGCYHDV